MLLDILSELGVFEVLRVGVDGVDGRITLLVGALLFEGIEAASYFLRALGDGLLEVTAGRRYGTDEGDGTYLAVVQIDITGTTVEVGDQSREVHRESIGTRQFLHTVTHLAQCLCPT